MRKINEIIVHCSATKPDWFLHKTAMEKRNEIERWHVEDNKWAGIGYHFLIDRDGTVVKGRDLDGDGDVFEEIGAHTLGHNKETIGVCLIGGFGSSEFDDPHKHFTGVQLTALRNLIDSIEDELGDLKLSGHNEYAAKACPGFQVRRWYEAKSPAPAMSGTEGGAMAGVGLSAVTGGYAALKTSEGWPVMGVVIGAVLIAVVCGSIWYGRKKKSERGRK